MGAQYPSDERDVTRKWISAQVWEFRVGSSSGKEVYENGASELAQFPRRNMKQAIYGGSPLERT